MVFRFDFGKVVDEIGINNCVLVIILLWYWGGVCVFFLNIFLNKYFENFIGICLYNDFFIFRMKIYFCMISLLNIDIYCIMRC